MVQSSTSRERVLNVAEQMFLEKGYIAVSMNDLARALGIQKASLYHHAHSGKEALFVEVIERMLGRYRQGLEQAIHEGEFTFQGRLRAAAYWLLHSPPLHYERMMQSDMPQLSEQNAARLTRSTYVALIDPLTRVFGPEMKARGVDSAKVVYLSGAFLSVIETVNNLPQLTSLDARLDTADFLIETLFESFGRKIAASKSS